MGVKDTSIGQVLTFGALALAGHQAYRYFNSKKAANASLTGKEDSTMDNLLAGASKVKQTLLSARESLRVN
ncbi:MAG: hypothetical protein EOP07_05380 [Proteobacteria bacterium]|nr:MAG: hypothetical protein EOP07_05380 [Pseudomonadota bacterium]